MTERVLLGLLCLSGWSVSSGLPRQYHYVADRRTWTEAQAYCRETYTDMVSVDSPEEMNQLHKTVLSSGFNTEVWIGLYGENDWRWSDGYTGSEADYRQWGANEPTLWSAHQFCVMSYTTWTKIDCLKNSTFFCYRGTQEDPEFVFVPVKRTWSGAQRYCRENFKDLATVRNDAEHLEIYNLPATQGWSRGWAWIGLQGNSHFYWSDGSRVSFTYWGSRLNTLGSVSGRCGAADLQRSGTWTLLHCKTRFPFVCYSLPAPAVKRQVVKLRMKPEESSVDLNDPAVKADILKKLQDRLKESGWSGATLKWREQPDGKVFHKEGKSSQSKD